MTDVILVLGVIGAVGVFLADMGGLMGGGVIAEKQQRQHDYEVWRGDYGLQAKQTLVRARAQRWVFLQVFAGVLGFVAAASLLWSVLR